MFLLDKKYIPWKVLVLLMLIGADKMFIGGAYDTNFIDEYSNLS